jgi:hypothetical protein
MYFFESFKQEREEAAFTLSKSRFIIPEYLLGQELYHYTEVPGREALSR